jgi:hypothetical protein
VPTYIDGVYCPEVVALSIEESEYDHSTPGAVAVLNHRETDIEVAAVARLLGSWT